MFGVDLLFVYCEVGSDLLNIALELQLSGLIGTPSHSDMQKVWIIRFFYDYRPHWQFAIRLLLSTVCTGV